MYFEHNNGEASQETQQKRELKCPTPATQTPSMHGRQSHHTSHPEVEPTTASPGRSFHQQPEASPLLHPDTSSPSSPHLTLPPAIQARFRPTKSSPKANRSSQKENETKRQKSSSTPCQDGGRCHYPQPSARQRNPLRRLRETGNVHSPAPTEHRLSLLFLRTEDTQAGRGSASTATKAAVTVAKVRILDDGRPCEEVRISDGQIRAYAHMELEIVASAEVV